MDRYMVRSLDSKAMDSEEQARPRLGYEQRDRAYIEATLDPTEGTFRVTLDNKVLERVPIN